MFVYVGLTVTNEIENTFFASIVKLYCAAEKSFWRHSESLRLVFSHLLCLRLLHESCSSVSQKYPTHLFVRIWFWKQGNQGIVHWVSCCNHWVVIIQESDTTGNRCENVSSYNFMTLTCCAIQFAKTPTPPELNPIYKGLSRDLTKFKISSKPVKCDPSVRMILIPHFNTVTTTRQGTAYSDEN